MTPNHEDATQSEITYLNLLRLVMSKGKLASNRTGVNTIRIFGAMAEYDLTKGFPLITTKHMSRKAMFGELVGFIRGYTWASEFRELGCYFWDDNANKNRSWLNNYCRKGEDDLGLIYGWQWRHYGRSDIDQLQQAIDTIKTDPDSRRIIVTAWNPEDLDKMALPPCHVFYQFSVDGDHLDMLMYQRSCDLFLGVPYNIASYAALLTLIAKLTDKTPRMLVHSMGDVHIYSNHFDQVKEQLSRNPRPAPGLAIKDIARLDDITPDHFQVTDYNHHPRISAPMAI